MIKDLPCLPGCDFKLSIEAITTGEPGPDGSVVIVITALSPESEAHIREAHPEQVAAADG